MPFPGTALKFQSETGLGASGESLEARVHPNDPHQVGTEESHVQKEKKRDASQKGCLIE